MVNFFIVNFLISQVVARRPLPGSYRCVFWFAIKEREFFATLGLVIPLSQILPIADSASGGQTPPSRLLSVRFLVCYKGEGIFARSIISVPYLH